MKYFALDCETGGVESKVSLLSVYGDVLDHDLNIIDSIDIKIKPNDGYYTTTAMALTVNGIDIVKHDKEAVTETEAAKLLYDFAFKHASADEKIIPIGHNVSFDIRFIKNLFATTGYSERLWDKFFSYRLVDTSSISQFLKAVGFLPEEMDCSLRSLAEYFNLSYEGAHEAKFDTKLTVDVLKMLISLTKRGGDKQ